MPSSHCLHGGKVNGRNGRGFSSSSSTLIPGISHHSKQRPPSPATRDEEKRRGLDDKWKVGNSDKTLHERVTLSSRGPAFDEPPLDPLSTKHSLSSRLSKSNRAPSLDYVRLKNPPEPPEPSSLAKKRSKEKPVDKVSRLNVRGWNALKWISLD